MKRNTFMNKKIQLLFIALAGVALLTACGEKKKSKDIIAPRVVESAPKEPVRMQDYTDERDVQWIGKTYHVAIHRHSSDSLPMVKDETGQQFIDNVFTLAVTRADGSVFYSQKFTKKSVQQYLDDYYRKAGILEGLVFDRVEGNDLILAGSVGLPQTDEYIPLVIRLSRTGNLTISRDTQMDTTGDMQEPDSASEEI